MKDFYLFRRTAPQQVIEWVMDLIQDLGRQDLSDEQLLARLVGMDLDPIGNETYMSSDEALVWIASNRALYQRVVWQIVHNLGALERLQRCLRAQLRLRKPRVVERDYGKKLRDFLCLRPSVRWMGQPVLA